MREEPPCRSYCLGSCPSIDEARRNSIGLLCRADGLRCRLCLPLRTQGAGGIGICFHRHVLLGPELSSVLGILRRQQGQLFRTPHGSLEGGIVADVIRRHRGYSLPKATRDADRNVAATAGAGDTVIGEACEPTPAGADVQTRLVGFREVQDPPAERVRFVFREARSQTHNTGFAVDLHGCCSSRVDNLDATEECHRATVRHRIRLARLPLGISETGS